MGSCERWTRCSHRAILRRQERPAGSGYQDDLILADSARSRTDRARPQDCASRHESRPWRGRGTLEAGSAAVGKWSRGAEGLLGMAPITLKPSWCLQRRRGEPRRRAPDVDLPVLCQRRPGTEVGGLARTSQELLGRTHRGAGSAGHRRRLPVARPHLLHRPATNRVRPGRCAGSDGAEAAASSIRIQRGFIRAEIIGYDPSSPRLVEHASPRGPRSRARTTRWSRRRLPFPLRRLRPGSK